MIKRLQSCIWMQEDHFEHLLRNYADAVCLKRNRNNSKTRLNRVYVYTKLFVLTSRAESTNGTLRINVTYF